MSVPDELIESVAEGMWHLVRSNDDRDWKWCVEKNSMLADDLRFRARCAVMNSEFHKVEKQQHARLDLSFKHAFVGNK